MKLYLMRHAEAENGPSDELREISSHGRKEAKAVAQFLEKSGARLDAVYSSPLVRAQQTAALVATLSGKMPESGVLLEEALLNETPQDVFERWLSSLKYHKEALLVGHAPTIGMRVRHLLGHPFAHSINFPTAGIACLERASNDETCLVFFITPGSLGIHF